LLKDGAMQILPALTALAGLVSLASLVSLAGLTAIGCHAGTGGSDGDPSAVSGEGDDGGAGADGGIVIPHIPTGPGLSNVVVGSSKNPAVSGTAITFVAAIAPAASTSTYPTGSVYFTIDGVVQPPVPVTNGSAALTDARLPAGNHDVTATYIGDPTYAEKVSSPYKQAIGASFDPPWHRGLDVTTQGLVGDGLTDNTAALRRLIASIPGDATSNGTAGGQVLYFPPGTYVVTDTIDFSALVTFAIEGAVDADGNPTSILKSDRISSSITLDDPHAPGATVTWSPMVKTSHGNYGSGGSFEIRNMQFVASDAPGSVAFLILDGSNQSFDNCVFTAFRGLQMYDSVVGTALRNVKFIGHGVPSSIGLASTNQLVEGSYFAGWAEGIRTMRCGLSIAHSTFERNATGIVTGQNILADGNSFNSCSSFDDLTFKDNDVAMALGESVSIASNIRIEGSESAPSGASRAGLELLGGQGNTFTGLTIGGVFAAAPVHFLGDAYTTSFYATTAANAASSGAPGWAFEGPGDHPCPGGATCALNAQPPFTDVPIACSAGMMTALSADYSHAGAPPVDCTAYVAAQCNGKPSCTLHFDQTNCPVTQTGTGNGSANARIACSSGPPNGAPSTITHSDSLLPHFVAEADDVTAGNVVAALQPTESAHAMLIDVTTKGVVGDGSTDNAPALKALIDGAAPGTVFYFPHGVYKVGSTLDFSRLATFTLLGDVRSMAGNTNGSTIAGSFGDAPLLRMDYGSGAGTFQLRSLNLTGGSDAVFARNAVLSNIQDVQTSAGNFGIHLENPFMVSMRTAVNNGSGIAINGGMRATVEVQTVFGGSDGVRMTGTGHALFASHYESNSNAAISLGVDPDGKPAPLLHASVAGVWTAANVLNITMSMCQECSVSAMLSSGLHDSKVGLTIDDVHDTTFAGISVGGAYESNPAILIKSKASNLLFADVNGYNGATSDGAVGWLVESGATNIAYDQAAGR
jgi:hypothetical protein